MSCLCCYFLHWKHRLYTVSKRCVLKSTFVVFEVEPVYSLPAGLACILLYILWGWIGVAGPPARMVIAQACRSGRSLSRGSQAENLCAIPMPRLRAQDNPSITICFCTMPSSGQTNGTGPGSCFTPSAPLPRGLEGGNLLLGHRGNCYTDSSALYWMARVSLTVGKDKGPYDNKTPAVLCLFNTNDKLPCLRGAGSFWKTTLCWQAKQMRGRDTKSVYWRVHNHRVDLKLKDENNGSGRCSDQNVWNVCVEVWSFVVVKVMTLNLFSADRFWQNWCYKQNDVQLFA